MNEPILPYLQRKLKEATPSAWPAIAEAANAALPAEKKLTLHSLRKIAYGDRDNPGLQQVQALLDHFQATEPTDRAAA